MLWVINLNYPHGGKRVIFSIIGNFAYHASAHSVLLYNNVSSSIHYYPVSQVPFVGLRENIF